MPADTPRQISGACPRDVAGACRPGPELAFESPAALTPLESGVMGQARGIGAIQFGVGLKNGGYHIFGGGQGEKDDARTT